MERLIKRFFFRHSVIFLGVLFLLISITGCASDTKRFAEINHGFVKSEDKLKNDPGVIAAASAGNPDKNLFKVAMVVDRNIMTGDHFKQVIQSFLTSVASFSSEQDSQILFKPYNLQIEVKDINNKNINDQYQAIAEKPSGSTVIDWKKIEDWFNQFDSNDNFKAKAKEKGLTESMLKTLNNASFTEKEILELSPEKIAELFAPGTHWDGGGFDPDNNQKEELEKIGIDLKMSIILYNLGYQYEDMLKLSVKEIDFIFPNTELMANLQQKGFSEQEVQSKLEKWKTYKDIIKEAFTSQEVFVVFNETLEKYYDYFGDNNQIVVLLDNENGFTDDQLAAFAIMSFDHYDYEKGNLKEEYDAVTEKYFGRKIKNFNNSMSEIIPVTNMIRATGWSFDSRIFMILKSLIEEPDGSKTAEFYTLNISDSVFMDFIPQKTNEEIKKDLLSGEFSEYGNPFIVKLKFEEKTDETGYLYVKYLDIKIVDEIIETITPYGEILDMVK